MGSIVHTIFPSHLIVCVMVVLILKESPSYNVPCSTCYLLSMAMTITAFSIKLPLARVDAPVGVVERNIRQGGLHPWSYDYAIRSTLISRRRYTFESRISSRYMTRLVGEDMTMLPNIERIFVLSDLHTDHGRNMDWVIDRCTHPNENTPWCKDALLIAGDISHDLDILRRTFEVIQSTLQCSIFFIPGNHEAWIEKGKNYTNSFEKLDAVTQLCQQMGVYTTQCLVGTNLKSPSWIVPIHRYVYNYTCIHLLFYMSILVNV
jgi:hypothetical protein